MKSRYYTCRFSTVLACVLIAAISLGFIPTYIQAQGIDSLIDDDQPHECRFWGIISENAPGAVIQSHLVDDPYSIKALSGSNPDGWSVGYYPDGNDVPTINRGFPTANADPNFDLAVTEAAGATPRIAVSHIRNTSSGVTPAAGDPHPFERVKNGKHWLMGHNGTIDKNVLLDLIRDDYFAANPPLYGTDLTEWIDTDLYQIFVLQTLEDFGWQVKPALGYVIKKLREEIGPGTLPSTEQLNFFLTDGTTLWAYREGNTLWYLDETSSVPPYSAVASQYPSATPGNWVEMAEGQLITLFQDSAPDMNDSCPGNFDSDSDVDGMDLVECADNPGAVAMDVFAANFGQANCIPSAEPGSLLVDTDFEASVDGADLRANDPDQDWYESRNDVPTLLDLHTGEINGNTENTSKKASLINAGIADNAYLSQEFSTAQSGTFAVSFDIYIDQIQDVGSYDRAGHIYIGNDSDSNNIPTGTSNERFVFLAFYDDTPGDTGDDLQIRARTSSGQAYGTTSQWESVASGLSYDTWYKVELVLDAVAGLYDVYVDGLLVGHEISKYSGYPAVADLEYISFVADSDGRGNFYVDNASADASPALSTTPDTVGSSQTDAEAAILAAGLAVGDVTTAYSASVPAGDVISQFPPDTAQILSGTPVNLVVSLGLAPVEVPACVGMTQATAEAAIVAADLAVGTITEQYDAAPVGEVLNQDPASGIFVEVGTPVALWVSKGPEPTDLLVDTDFEASADGAELRANDPDQDWYESRNDIPTLLDLHTGEINGNTENTSKKASLINAGIADNAYLSQEFSTAQSGTFAVSFDIYIDQIQDVGSYDRAGHIYIGNDSDSNNIPTGTSNERFVFLAFYDDTPGDTGDDLQIRARTSSGQAYGTTSQWESVASGLSYDTWYKVELVLDAVAGLYDVYVDGLLVGHEISKYSGYPAVADLEYISFVADSDGRGNFYVDNASADASPALSTTPDTVGSSQTDAEAAILAAGLAVGDVTTAYSASVPAGDVISQFPPDTAQILSGTPVNLVVSLGLAPVEVPACVGMTQATAEAAIVAADLTVGTITRLYDAAPAGEVFDQDPASGSFAEIGAPVALWVSKGPIPAGLLVDTDFETSVDSADLRANDLDQDWYESRNDVETLLELHTGEINGNTENTSKKAKLTGSATGNAYLSQELKTVQTGIFSIQYDIYVDNIIDTSDPDRTGWTMIGDSSDGQRGPNSTGSERFVLMAFYKEGGGDTGTMDLVARETSAWEAGSFTKIATGLNLDQWYTIKVLCDVENDTYSVYVDGVYQKTLSAYTNKTSLTHISFATWNDGAGTFYVDNVMEVASTLYTLTVNPSPDGTVTLGPPGGNYPENTEVTLTPVPNAGWVFNEWDGDIIGGANPAKLVMDADMTVTPVFVAAPDVAMRVSPTLLDFGADGSVLTFDLVNGGNTPFDWTASADQPWVEFIDPAESTAPLGAGESVTLTVTVNRNYIGASLPDTNCRMWGAVSDTGLLSDTITEDLDEADNSLRNLTYDYNQEGWGMAYYTEFGDVPSVIRGPVQAFNSTEYIPAVDAMAAAGPKIGLAHVRNCTSGCCDPIGQEMDDPHPFYRQKNGKTWLFMHNGNISKTTLRNLIGEAYLAENPPNGSGIPLCDPDDFDLVVDSELYFLLILKHIEENNWSVESGIIAALRALGSANSINFIMSDGYSIWAFRRGQDLAFYHDEFNGYSAVASQPPNPGDPDWTIMSDNDMVILRPGEMPQLIDVINFADKHAATIHVETTLGESADVQATVNGPERQEVPDVAGLSLTAAENAITAAGFAVGNISHKYSPNVASGDVIIQSLTAGHLMAEGSEIDLVISLPATIIDNDDGSSTSSTGTWSVYTGGDPWDANSLLSNNGTFTWTFSPMYDGYYNVSIWYTVQTSRDTSVPVEIEHGSKDSTTVASTTVYLNQRDTNTANKWNSLRSYYFRAGVEYDVTITADSSSSTCADAVRFTKEGILRHKFTVDMPNGGDQMMPVMGDIDNDGTQEIVMVAKYYVVAVDGKTGEIQWSVSGATRTAPELVDLDNDGTPEVLHGMNDDNGPRLRAINGDGSVRWTSPYLPGDKQSLFPIVAYDIEGNGYPTIFFGTEDFTPDYYSGDIDDYDGALVKLNHNGQILDSTWIHKPCWSGMAIADADFDGKFEVYLGDRREGYHDMPANGLQAFDAHTLDLLWERPDIHHSSPLPILADVTGDANLEVVATNITLSGPLVLNATTGGTISNYTNRNLPTHATPTVYDIDLDGNLEYIVSASYPAQAPKNFVVFDLVDGTVDFEAYFDYWIAWPPKVGDVTGDGNMEIIVATGNQIDTVPDTFNGDYPILIYDKEFKLIDIVELDIKAGQLTPARVYDTDGDGFNEVVVPGFNGKLMVYDTDAETPNPPPRTWVQMYSEYRQGAPVYAKPPAAVAGAAPLGPIEIVDNHEFIENEPEPEVVDGYVGFE